MSLPTIIAAIVVALIISSIAAIAGYYLQTRLRRLEELEEERVAPAPEIPVPSPPLALAPEEPLTPIPVERPSVAASLTIIAGPRSGQSFALGINTLIGRNANLCDIVIDDPLVSRQHARIRQEGDQFYIYDLASANGTFVNGKAILRAELHDGDRISMGGTELEFKRA